MPIYEYQCQACQHEFETIQKFSDPPLTRCPECGKDKLKKKISAVAFRLKGGGWYETDFKSGDKKKNVASSSDGADSGDSSSKGESVSTSESTSGEGKTGKSSAKTDGSTKSSSDDGAKSSAKKSTKRTSKPTKRDSKGGGKKR